jgi:hypothetical protein
MPTYDRGSNPRTRIIGTIAPADVSRSIPRRLDTAVPGSTIDAAVLWPECGKVTRLTQVLAELQLALLPNLLHNRRVSNWTSKLTSRIDAALEGGSASSFIVLEEST